MGLEGLLFHHAGNRKYLNASERQRFYNAALGVDDSLRKAFLLTLYYTGARVSEALALEWTNLDADEGVIVIRTLKQRASIRSRAVPVPIELIECIRTTDRQERRIWGFCRTTGWKLVKKCMSAASIEGVKACPKGLRHGFAVACINAKVPVSTIKKWLGHTRLESTTVYLDLIGEDERDLARRLWKNGN
ncbi:integrase [Haloferula helveola]|uniref:Integrase n=1 Tax=Haloferula helveola TaxID=490095 RepID=A0ABM7RN21_9BACT|nr:integrase [Haloferula helveola]